MNEIELLEILTKYADEKYKAFNSRLIQAKPGGYGEKDKVIGVKVPTLRSLAKEFNLGFDEVEKLIKSDYHEIRMFALISLINLFKVDRERVVKTYLENTLYINNWDLVDISVKTILGCYCFENKDNSILEKLSISQNEWERRMSIVATLYHVSKGELDYPLSICFRHLNDKFSLNHKAVGWVLREVGKKDKELLTNFLISNIKEIKSVTLTYALEHFEKQEKENIRKLR